MPAAREGEDDFTGALAEVDRYARTLGQESERYWQLHRCRFEWVARLVKEMAAAQERTAGNPFRVLDVGNSFQTLLFAKVIPSANVDTLGFFDHRFSAGDGSTRYEMDLNDCYLQEKWPKRREDGYDVITFLEVVEHLYTSPLQVFSFLKTMLKPGGRIVLQTPNAAALKKRLKLLGGRNPYELIRTDRRNPGHFREYTVRDIEYYAKLTDFEVERVAMDSFLIDGKRFDRGCDRLSRYLPGSFKSGITAVLRLR